MPFPIIGNYLLVPVESSRYERFVEHCTESRRPNESVSLIFVAKHVDTQYSNYRESRSQCASNSSSFLLLDSSLQSELYKQVFCETFNRLLYS